MDWTVYWFVIILCFIFASVAMFSGISGAALMMPMFIMGFPVLGVPLITAEQAVASSLFLETGAFSIGIYVYWRRGFIHWPTVWMLIPLVIPLAIGGALVTHFVPERALYVVYSLLMLGASWLLYKRVHEEPKNEQKQQRLQIQGIGLQKVISGGGAFMTGMISTGIGEVTQPSLIVRSRFPVAAAAATSIVMVAIADISAILTHITQFMTREGAEAIPWNLIAWGVPGMIGGAFLGSWLQGRVDERAARLFFVGLFVVLGITFLIFTLFKE